MMLAGTTALATLLATASAMPTVNTEHRALAERRTLACWSGDYTAERCCTGAGGDASCWSGEYNFEACCGQHVAVAPANPQPAPDSAAMTPHTNFLGDLGGDDIDVAMATVMGPNFVQQVVEALVTDADGRHHLWFKSLDDRLPSLKRCGEIDAAPYMPAALFRPENLLELAAYAAATVHLYRTPVVDTAVTLGRCASAGYSVCGSGVQGIGWTPGALMGPVCGARCGCNFNGACTPAGNFPGFPSCEALPTCRDQPDDPSAGRFCSLCGPSTACPGCTSGTITIGLCYQPQPYVPPPATRNTVVDIIVNSDDHTTLVAAVTAANLIGTLGGRGPFTVFAPTDAAFAALPDGTLASLLADPAGALADILTYHVLGSAVFSDRLSNGQTLTTLQGTEVTVTINRDGVFINDAKVTVGDIAADNGVVHVIDHVLTPTPQPNADNHLWFYFVNTALDRCGEVDAAPLMPEDIFKPRNVLTLAAYVEATVRLYSVTFATQSFGRGSIDVTVKLGRCASEGYTVAGTGVTAGPLRGGNGKAATAVASWTPNSLMGPTCEAKCNCQWPTRSNAYPQPGDLPLCGTGWPTPDPLHNPDETGFCALCGTAACPKNPAGCGNQAFGIGDGVSVSLYYQPCTACSQPGHVRGCRQGCVDDTGGGH